MPDPFPKRAVVFSLTLFFLVALVSALALWAAAHLPAEKGGTARVVVLKAGLSLREVAEELEAKELLRSKSLFLIWARLTGKSRMIKAGEYELSPAMTPDRILETLTLGLVMTHGVTIPEGFSRDQIARQLASRDLVDAGRFLALTEDQGILRGYGLRGPSLEGYLYPDTYQFARGLSARVVIDVMVRRFLAVLGPLREKIRDSGMSLEEVVTLASIVEKETGRAEERPLIASVFLNRLRRGMRLESDPTVIYGLQDFNGNLTRRDLQRPTAYNTYVIRGLPPGPIASPGLGAIRAVLHPSETNYLYFVSKNDGSHHFSKSLSEHNRAVARYQKKSGAGRKKMP